MLVLAFKGSTHHFNIIPESAYFTLLRQANFEIRSGPLLSIFLLASALMLSAVKYAVASASNDYFAWSIDADRLKIIGQVLLNFQ